MRQRAPQSPLSFPVVVTDVPEKGLDVIVEADARERADLARDFEIPSVESLIGRFHIAHTGLGLRVTGEVRGRITQTCAVSLEAFETEVVEPVEVDCADPATIPEASADAPGDADPPDPIVDGAIDLGALTAEFLALGIDPYPRKPGVDFRFEDEAGKAALSPFARLAVLKPTERKG